METNFDEQILEAQRIDLNTQQPIKEQILRIAVYDEFKLYETYTAIMAKFGYVQPFANIKDAEARHYAELITLLEKHEIEVPINNWADKVEVPKSYIEAAELGVANEIQNIAMYDNLLQYAQDDDIKNILYKLQAASYNNHLPAFRNAVINYYTSQQSSTSNFNQEELMQKLGEYQSLFDDVMSGNVDQSKLTELFSKFNISMISGAAFGAATIAFLNSYIEDKNNKE